MPVWLSSARFITRSASTRLPLVASRRWSNAPFLSRHAGSQTDPHGVDEKRPTAEERQEEAPKQLEYAPFSLESGLRDANNGSNVASLPETESSPHPLLKHHNHPVARPRTLGWIVDKVLRADGQSIPAHWAELLRTEAEFLSVPATPEVAMPFACLGLKGSSADAWMSGQIMLNLRYTLISTDEQRDCAVPVLHVHAAEWAEAVVEQLEEGEVRIEELAARFEVDPMWLWTQISLWMLAYNPAAMLELLVATLKGGFAPPAEYLRDALDVLSICHWHTPDRFVILDEAILVDILCDLFSRKEGLSFKKHWMPFYVIQKTAQYPVARKVHRNALRHGALLGYHTVLRFTALYAKEDRVDEAIDALSEASERGARKDAFAFLSNCSTILRRSMLQEDGLRKCMQVVHGLVDIGVRLDGPIRDIILLNSVDAGDAKTAFAVHESFLADGVEPTECTFHALLLACQLDIGNVVTLNDTIHGAIEYCNVRQSNLLSDTILQTLSLHHTRHNPATAYRTLVDAYSELYDPQPLLDLRLPWTDGTNTHHTRSSARNPPSRYALVIMLRAYIAHLILNQRPLRSILSIYLRWRELIAAGDARYVELLDSDHMVNAFLIALTATNHTLGHATHVIKTMLNPPPAVVAAAAALNITPVKPSTRTWNIYLHGFVHHRHTAMAERVLAQMQASGVQTDPCTWNSLVLGYAISQDVPGVRETLLRMERDNQMWDSWTHAAVDKVERRDELAEEILRGTQREKTTRAY